MSHARASVLLVLALLASALMVGNALAQLIAPAAASSPAAAAGSSDAAQREIESMRREQQDLLAQIRREIALLPPPLPAGDEARLGSRRRFLTAASAQGDYASYYLAMCSKIEARGTQNFPADKGHKLYGELIMNITVDARGRVVEADVVRPSNSRVLDQQAIAIVQSAAPFARFSKQMRREVDQIVVTSRFKFTRDNDETRDEAQVPKAQGCQGST
jgi:periplasmic protein TonB